MHVKLKENVNPFKIHNGKEWVKVFDGAEVDETTFKSIKGRVNKIKKDKPKEAKK